MSNNSGKVILFLGGARSGKSALAEKIATSYRDVAYVATAKAIDDEMLERIKKHRQSRPDSWVTFEVDNRLDEVLGEAFSQAEAIIVDCLTVYIAVQMDKTASDDEIVNEIVGAVKGARESGKTVIFVTNEVGMGIVPEYPVGRRYRDLLGIINQKVAEHADQVLLTIAGIPVDVKSLSVIARSEA